MKLLGFCLHLLFNAGIYLATVYYFYLFLNRPLQFRSLNYVNLTNASIVKRVMVTVYLFSAMGGIGYCIYSFTLFALWWMPHGWQNYDVEDGTSEWWGHSIAVFLAIMGSFALVIGMSELNRRLVEAERNQT